MVWRVKFQKRVGRSAAKADVTVAASTKTRRAVLRMTLPCGHFLVALYLATCVHCFLRTMVISRELDAAHRVAALVSSGVSGFNVAGQNVVTSEGARLPPGQVTDHIRNLILKSRLQGGHHIDQTLLLRGLADALRGPN